MRRVHSMAAICFALVCLFGAFALPTHAAPSVSAADFLKQSMARYQALQTFQATCIWSEFHMTDTRTIAYVKPNQFKVVSKSQFIVMTAVSDGTHLVEYSTVAATGAMTYAAPASIANVTSMQMQHPMFCGSLLYKFFGGPAGLANLAQSSKEAIHYGPDVSIAGEPCRTVLFYGTGLYGHAQAAISLRDGLVRRITYDSAPLMAMVGNEMQTLKKKLTPGMLITTETYQGIETNEPVAAATFSTSLPKGVTATDMTQAASTDETPPVALGHAAPDFTVTPLGGGATVALSSQRGHVVLLDFWATWCPPCRRSLPETQSLYSHWAARGLRVMTIDDETAPTIAAFRTKYHYTFPSFRDADEQASKAYKVSAIPTLVVIDAQGNLQGYFVGLQNPDTVQAALKKAGLQ